jgi:riboflavin-specific deaminase-like protein
VRQIFPVPASSGGPLGLADPLRLAGPITADTAGVADLIDALGAVYAYPDDDQPWVRANMVTSVDGAISVEGRSGGLSGEADRLLFHVLRGLSDVIVVGAGTARAENYGLAKPTWPQLRAGRPATPPIAIVTRRLGLDLDSPLIVGDPERPRTIILTTCQAPTERVTAASKTADVISAGSNEVTAKAVVEKLAALGYRRILVEGGPTLLGQLVAANLLDELCATVSPLLEGGGQARRMLLSSDPVNVSSLNLASVLEDDGFLLSRYVRA